MAVQWSYCCRSDEQSTIVQRCELGTTRDVPGNRQQLSWFGHKLPSRTDRLGPSEHHTKPHESSGPGGRERVLSTWIGGNGPVRLQMVVQRKKPAGRNIQSPHAYERRSRPDRQLSGNRDKLGWICNKRCRQADP